MNSNFCEHLEGRSDLCLPLGICDVYAISNEPPKMSVQTKFLSHDRSPFTHLTVIEDEDDIMIFKANREQYNTLKNTYGKWFSYSSDTL